MRVRKILPRETWRIMGFTAEDYNKVSKINCETALYHQAWMLLM